MASGFKHLLTCRCVLPQFKKVKPAPPEHQFPVFSIIDDDGTFRMRFAQCNNCGIIHKVIDICRSEIVNKEAMVSIPTIDEIKSSLPSGLVNLLESNSADIATWEAVQFIIDNKQWGNFVVLSTDEIDGVRQGKYVRLLSETMFKVETFTRNEVLT